MFTKKIYKLMMLAVFAALFLTASAQAATFTVNSTADPGDGVCDTAECTLREAINAANAAAGSDVVDFDPTVFNTARTITLTNGEIVITQSLNVQGPGAGLLTVSGNNNGRIFAMTTNNVDLTISGLTLQNGNGTGASNSGFGGAVAVFASGGSFTMNNVTVNNNTAANGGGIIVAFGIPATISNSTFSNNTTTGQGGAIQMQNGTMTITNSTFSNNTANINDPLRGGGAIRLTSGTLNVTGSTFSNNNAPNGSGGSINSSGSAELNNSTISGGSAILGGGIRNINTLTLNGVTVRNNNATSAGGGIANTDTGNATLNNSTVSGNTTVDTGGGIYNNNATLTLNNSTVSGNTGANFGGGGIRVEAGSTANLNSSTISDNSAANSGGGISVVDAGSTATLNNTIIANSTSGGDCFNSSATINADYSLIEDNLTCVNGTNSNNMTGDPNLGPLQNNGGTTQTHALLAGSIAIDTGNSTLTTDQRGAPRPVDEPNSANGAGNLADIGAFEVQLPQSPPYTVNSTNDPGDGVCDATECTLREAINAANATAVDDIINFDPTVFNSQQTITLSGTQLTIANNSGSLTINGTGANRLTVSGNNASRVFLINSGATLTINGITVTGANPGSTDINGFGGGFHNSGTLTLNNLTINNNSARFGGGIWAQTGALNVNNSTLSSNTATATGSGSAIYKNSGTMSLINTTISNNPGNSLYTRFTSVIDSSTISNNGEGIFNDGGDLTLNNSIIANGNSLCVRNSGTINASYTLIEDNLTCVNGTNSNNQTGDPNLGPLQNNGGATQTHALLAGSIAIDTGNSTETTDQRGQPRPVNEPNSANGAGNLADIGAFEVQAPTSAGVSITGRVINGRRGVSRAMVHVTDQNGNFRSVRTNQLGYFRIDGVQVGQTIIVNVYHKRFQFETQVVTVNENIENLDFTVESRQREKPGKASRLPAKSSFVH